MKICYIGTCKLLLVAENLGIASFLQLLVVTAYGLVFGKLLQYFIVTEISERNCLGCECHRQHQQHKYYFTHSFGG